MRKYQGVALADTADLLVMQAHQPNARRTETDKDDTIVHELDILVPTSVEEDLAREVVQS